MPVRAAGIVVTRMAEFVIAACEKFLDANDRARVQWKLEREFTELEKEF